MASLDDLVTAAKNAVSYLGSLANTYAGLYSFTKGTSLFRGSMPTGIVQVYVVPTNFQTTITDIEVCNTAGATGTFSIYLVPSGGVASASNALFLSQSVTANMTFQWKGSQVITAGMTIQCSGSATSLTLMITGGVG